MIDYVLWRMVTIFNGRDVCLANEITPVMLSWKSPPTMCHAELFREATGGSDQSCDHRLEQNAMLFSSEFVLLY
jgi:hypothetical protein